MPEEGYDGWTVERPPQDHMFEHLFSSADPGLAGCGTIENKISIVEKITVGRSLSFHGPAPLIYSLLQILQCDQLPHAHTTVPFLL